MMEEFRLQSIYAADRRMDKDLVPVIKSLLAGKVLLVEPWQFDASYLKPLHGKIIAVPIYPDKGNIAILLELDKPIFVPWPFLISLRRVRHVLVILIQSYEEVKLFAEGKDVHLGWKTREPNQFKDSPELHSLIGQFFFVTRPKMYTNEVTKFGVGSPYYGYADVTIADNHSGTAVPSNS